MSQQTMVVTGASSGIGRALGVLAASRGYAVVAVGRSSERLASLAEEIRIAGGAVETVAADVSDPKQAARIVRTALERFGRIDVVVNNAGEVAAGPLAAQSDSSLARQFLTHVIGPIAIVREALDALRLSGGHVFMLGSGVARVPVGGLGAYPASKAAIRSATSTLRRELAPQGIAVTYVDPGAVDTGFMERGGMASAPKSVMIAPEVVARAIMRAVPRRPREVNAVPYQTMFVALAERFPRLTDLVLERMPELVGGQPAAATAAAAPPEPALAVPHGAPAPATAATREAASSASLGAAAGNAGDARTEVQDELEALPAQTPFEASLSPLARRMERLKLPAEFVRGLLVPGRSVELGDVAMRWAGMPNKNERALVADILAALAEAGYVEPSGDETWNVVRAAD